MFNVHCLMFSLSQFRKKMTKTALISSFFLIFRSDGKPNGGEVLSLANSHPRANFDRSHDRFAKKINFGPIFREIFFSTLLRI